MSNKNFEIIMKHALNTDQLALKDGQWALADNASKLVVKGLDGILANGVLKPDNIDPTTIANSVLSIFAERKIQKKYAQLGGKKSQLGLPLYPATGVQSSGNTYFMDFRGGRIEITDPLSENPAIAYKMRFIEVWWVGLECRIRQEKTDEIYGTVAAIIPGSGMSNTHKFPGDREYWDMGPDGQRIVQVGVPLYKGPPMSLTLVGSLVEHDSGNIEAYKQKIAQVIADAAKGLAVYAGVPAEAVAADQGFINDLSLGLVNGVSSILGADDDPYVPQVHLLHAFDILKRNYTRQTLHRADDPHFLEYTHSIVVSGIDQGNDRGEYAFYFDVRQFDVQEVLP